MQARSVLLLTVVVVFSLFPATSAESQQCGNVIRIFTDPASGVVKASPDPHPPGGYCHGGEKVVWQTKEGDLEIVFDNGVNPQPFPPPDCTGYGICVGRVHSPNHPQPKKYKYIATIRCDGKECVRSSDPELVIAGGGIDTDKKKKKVNTAPKRLGGGDPQEDSSIVTITLYVHAHTVTADPEVAIVRPGDTVEWRANRGSLQRVMFLDPGSNDFPRKKRNDKAVPEPSCSAGKCTLTVPSLEAWKSYTYFARVLHDNKKKYADPELVVAGEGPP
jgi:hypothetical protein